MREIKANELLRHLNEYVRDALEVEIDEKEMSDIKIETRSNHSNGMVAARELVVKIKIDMT